jgi:hypothetical protein
MIGLTLLRQKWIDLDDFAANDVENIAAKSLALISALFAEYLRANKLSGQVYPALTGETRESTKQYAARKRFGTPAYIVRPGVGIPGNLNYLYGMARGYAVRNGEAFRYDHPRPFLKEGWREFRAGGKVRTLTEAVKASYMNHLSSGSPEIETLGAGS